MDNVILHIETGDGECVDLEASAHASDPIEVTWDGHGTSGSTGDLGNPNRPTRPASSGDTPRNGITLPLVQAPREIVLPSPK